MMKLNKQIIVAILIMIATSALYRVLPGRPYGFAPQIAIALFGGSLFASKKQFAFILPILSMFKVAFSFDLTGDDFKIFWWG